MNKNKMVRHVMQKIYEFMQTCSTPDERLYGKCSHCGIRRLCISIKSIKTKDRERRNLGFETVLKLYFSCIDSDSDKVCLTCPLKDDESLCLAFNMLYNDMRQKIISEPQWARVWGCGKDCDDCDSRFICFTE